jgi:hypothetical protein
MMPGHLVRQVYAISEHGIASRVHPQAPTTHL